MKKDDIQSWDWQRILFGQAPPTFLVEVLIRTIIVYLFLLVILRLLGKRMDGQLTLTEMAVVVTFGAIVSVPMQLPDKGILLGILALLLAAAFQRGFNWLNVKNDKMEEITQGTMNILVKDGLVQLDEMKKVGLSKQHLFAALRKEKIFNLGNVKRVYFEACGLFSIYSEEEAKPGLPTFPSNELEFVHTQTKIDESRIACCNCGYVAETTDRNISCENCGDKNWIEAIY
ncbi:DUF421 domain-containing protein [Chryseosolibacter indicus]|uniref:DUF421 domain-containing protein n=1 Tax=Chryseosolibacter indicus TaxID=2782351 RepID=A0ABS5VN34_9BACT|nr:YetF domain-containing protein [Chryseosolibacter indicus]MBT1702870.1 DUF421 domain-containing protein [Chryseosolibacter indicus]